MLINGQIHEFPQGTTVTQLLELLNVTPERIVVEVNGEIVDQELYESLVIDASAQVEIVAFVGGG